MNLSKKSSIIQFFIQIDVRYIFGPTSKLAASTEFNLLDVSKLDKQIVDFPEGYSIDRNSEAYKNFIEFVNKVDELLELRQFDVLGESDSEHLDFESVYRGIVFNICKDVDDKHISGKIEHIIRISGHKESRSSRRKRLVKHTESTESEEALKLNFGKPLQIRQFQSIVIKCKVSDKSKSHIENKEFYSYLDALKCVDQILDSWS